MFCPGCGMAENQANQYCRACGTDLRSVRNALERPDKITASAITARDEISRAVAAKIRSVQSAKELAVVVEDVLPELEKFLESPEEKRLRRIRAGTIISSVGMGAAIGLTVLGIATKNEDPFFLAALGIVTFFIGLGFILNGIFLTVPRKRVEDRAAEAEQQRVLDTATPTDTNDLRLPDGAAGLFSSVTENTTQHLGDKRPETRARN